MNDRPTAAHEAARNEETTMDEERATGPDAEARARGQRLAAYGDTRRKSVVLACVLSLMPGLGQIYVGFYRVGFVHLLVFASIIALLSSGADAGLATFLGISLGFLFFYNIVDAGRRATLYNLALEGLGPGAIPDGFGSGRGSLAGGLVLIGLGGLLLARLRFDVPMDWLEDWWPLGLVLMGVYLVLQNLRQRRGEG